VGLNPTLLTLLPFVAHAERRLTYRCDGIEMTGGGGTTSTAGKCGIVE